MAYGADQYQCLLVPMPPTSDWPSNGPEDPEDHPDDRQDDADGPQNRDFEHEAQNEQNDAENYHRVRLPSREPEIRFQC